MSKTDHSHSSSTEIAGGEHRDKVQAVIRGVRMKCPNCGKGSMFTSYLKVADTCSNCGEELFHQQSDDAAPYFTIFILGHIIVPIMVMLEIYVFPPFWAYLVIGLPLVIALTLATLPRVKGAVVATQWALRMHGFDPRQASTHPDLDPEIIGQE